MDREKFLKDKILGVSEETIHKKTISCIKATELKFL
jgi:hypothetical protein